MGNNAIANTQYREWLKDLKQSLQSNAPFNGALDPTKCALGQWLLKDRSGDVGDLINDIRIPHINFHEFGAEALKLRSHSQDEALLYFEEHIVVDDSQSLLGQEAPTYWRLIGNDDYLVAGTR